MRRINLFLKGNLDLRDSLHSCRINGALCWNGINEIMRERHADLSVRIRHETWTRSDALLAADGHVPPALLERQLAFGSYPPASQFSTALFQSDADVIVLSIQPDIATNLLRHRTDGYLLYPGDMDACPHAERLWLRAEFAHVAPLGADVAMDNLRRIVEACRSRADVPILIYNMSSIVPGDLIHCHRGMEDILATRIRRFNLGLVELSQETGVSIVDVDHIVARHGGDRLKLDAVHLSAEGCRLVADEVVSILADVLCL